MKEDRKIVYDLLNLSYPARMHVLLTLGLAELRVEDDAKTIKEALRRAKELGIIEKLKEAIETAK